MTSRKAKYLQKHLSIQESCREATAKSRLSVTLETEFSSSFSTNTRRPSMYETATPAYPRNNVDHSNQRFALAMDITVLAQKLGVYSRQTGTFSGLSHFSNSSLVSSRLHRRCFSLTTGFDFSEQGLVLFLDRLHLLEHLLSLLWRHCHEIVAVIRTLRFNTSKGSVGLSRTRQLDHESLTTLRYHDKLKCVRPDVLIEMP